MSRPQIATHMFPRDLPVWASFYLTEQGQEYDAWEFDVTVGNPKDPGAFYPPAQRRQSIYLSALKIDAVAWFLNTPRIIEFKPDAGCGALGQVLIYQEWYRIIFGVKPVGMVVCESMSDQVESICNLFGVAVIQLPPASDFDTEQAEWDVERKIVHRSVLPLMQALRA
jgi:hypothetical protein